MIMEVIINIAMYHQNTDTILFTSAPITSYKLEMDDENAVSLN